jgi:hypothetical protein
MMSNEPPAGVENLLYLLHLVAEDSAQLAANLITVNGLLLKMADRGEIETVMSVWYGDKNDLERQLQRNAISTSWLRSQIASCLSIYYESGRKPSPTDITNE